VNLLQQVWGASHQIHSMGIIASLPPWRFLQALFRLKVLWQV
jgi:hypothetical protein